MVFESLSQNVSSLYLFINSTRIEAANAITCFGIDLTLHLKWNEHCKSLVSRANKRGYKLWRLSQINIDEECLLKLYKSWLQPLFLYAKAC